MGSKISTAEFEKIALVLRGAYHAQGFLSDRGAIAVWYESLKDIPGDSLRMAVQRYIATQKFPPSIAELRAAAAGADHGGEGEAWAMVRKALSRSGAPERAAEEWEKLPETVRRGIGSPMVLCSWAMMETAEVETVVKSLFLKAFREAEGQRRQREQMPESLRPGITTWEPERIASTAAAGEDQAGPEENQETDKAEIMKRYRETMERIRRDGARRRQQELRRAE